MGGSGPKAQRQWTGSPRPGRSGPRSARAHGAISRAAARAPTQVRLADFNLSRSNGGSVRTARAVPVPFYVYSSLCRGDKERRPNPARSGRRSARILGAEQACGPGAGGRSERLDSDSRRAPVRMGMR